MLQIPVVTAMDFEMQPANHIAFRLASTIVLPEAFPARACVRQGASPQKIRRYPGLKEEVYIGNFDPDQAILEKLGLSPRPGVVVVARTPPSRAVYHQFANPLFEGAVRSVCARPNTVCVVLPRHSEQRSALEAMGFANCVVPHAAVDSRSLLYAADAMIGAGGTMTREAALMGVPTWTVFAGSPPAVDQWLERHGKLARLTSLRDLDKLGARPLPPREPDELREQATAIERIFVDATLAACPGPRGLRRAMI
jgi:hypothetical protein